MEDLLSSPDPLNDSPTFQSPSKTRRTSPVRASLPLGGNSPTKQTFELDVGNQISPQKIRVTVEAGHSDTENGYTHWVEGTRVAGTSPSRPRGNRRMERTVTTTVPVKGLSDSEDEEQDGQVPKRGRGRPRKSAGTPVPAKKSGRAGTPMGKNRRRRKSIGDLVDGDDEEDYNFQIGKGVQVGRGKGRSRSRSVKGASRKPASAAKEIDDRVLSSIASKKGRGRRKSLLPDEITVLEDENSGGFPEPENADPDTDRALQPIDDNGSYPPSVYSTIRGANEPDLVIARFDPGNETPRKTGWSSPRVIDPTRPSSPIFDKYPSPSQSPEKNGHQCEGSVSTNTVSPEQPQRSSAQDHYEGEQYDDETENRLCDMPEFDTILESEGFSMISVDSVPSLREHLSSPINQQEKIPSALKKKNLDYIKGLETPRDDSFSTIPDGVLQAVTSARKPQNVQLLSVQNSRVDDSFSSIPPEVLEAATPARKTLVSKLQSRRDSRVEDSFSSIAPEVLEAATPGRDLPKPKSLQPMNSQGYEDSFSAIPSAVLEAATPAAAHHASPRPRIATTQTNILSHRLSVPPLSRPNSSARRNSTNQTTARLLTPEETPSPSTDSIVLPGSATGGKQTEVPPAVSVDHLSVNESSIHSHLRSSPPAIAPRRYTYTAHLRQRRELHPDMTQTPSIVFSSPSLPPLINVARGQPALSVHTEEIGLSLTARAGRALQDAVGPNSSPRGRAQSLGSPFKSPVVDRKSSSSIAPSSLSPAQERRANPLPKLNAAGGLFPSPWSTIRHQDDPFSNDAPAGQQEKPPAQKQVYTLGLPEQRRLPDLRLSTIRSEANSVLSDDAMSWQAEEEVTADDATTSLVNNINSSAGHRSSSTEPNRLLSSEHKMSVPEQKWAAERDAVRKQIESASTSEVIVIDSDGESSHGAGIDEDDEDELLLETLNSSSPDVQQAQPLVKDNAEKPRRSKLPSPWRKNSKRLVYSDELSHISSPPHPKLSLAQSFVKKNVVGDDNALDLSSFVIPQKENFMPRIRESGNLDLSALLASSPNKTKLPVLAKSSQPSTSIPPEPSYTSASSFQSEKNSGGAEPQLFKPIPQKLGFQLRGRDVGGTDASSLFGSSPLKSNNYVGNIFGAHSNTGIVVHNPTPELSSSSTPPVPIGLSSPSRSNSLRILPQRTPSQPSESECSYDSSRSPRSEDEKGNQSIDSRTLKWTETVRLVSAQMQPLVSPTKSILRSPVKTPSNGSGSGSNGASTSPSKNVAFVSSSPLPSSPESEPLSSTTWSRDHWVLLASIIETWKPENNGGSEDGPKTRRRNSTRVISRLLGKKVFSMGEEMRLKQWHLEVVDEFRGMVPGWEEKVIAMRVFACIVGEEQRKRAVVRNGEEVEQNV